MKKTTPAVIVVTAIAIAGSALSRGAQHGDTSDQIESLREDRRDTLHNLVEIVASRQKVRGGHELTLLDARRELLSAELDLAESHEERVRIHEKIVENLHEVEAIMRGRHESGTALPDDMLRAKATRLKTAIRLLEVKSSTQ